MLNAIFEISTFDYDKLTSLAWLEELQIKNYFHKDDKEDQVQYVALCLPDGTHLQVYLLLSNRSTLLPLPLVIDENYYVELKKPTPKRKQFS